MEKLSKELAEEMKETLNDMGYNSGKVFSIHQMIDSFTKKSPDECDCYFNFNGYKRAEPISCTKCGKKYTFVEVEKPPEEELAGYKCPLCGKARLYYNGSMIICEECDCGLGSTVDYAKKHACYQPDWRGGKV